MVPVDSGVLPARGSSFRRLTGQTFRHVFSPHRRARKLHPPGVRRATSDVHSFQLLQTLVLRELYMSVVTRICGKAETLEVAGAISLPLLTLVTLMCQGLMGTTSSSPLVVRYFYRPM